MRLNTFIARATDLSRRAADTAIEQGRVRVNQSKPSLGQIVHEGDNVYLDGKLVHADKPHQTIVFNKPTGYVCSRRRQGNKTIYDLLPASLSHLKPVGRLDKDTSGLLLLTNDGQLANRLSHPRYQKQKVYLVKLDKPLNPADQKMICNQGVQLDDGPSVFAIQKIDSSGTRLQLSLTEGRNRQIRRTFSALGYQVVDLHRTQVSNISLGTLKSGQYRNL